MWRLATPAFSAAGWKSAKSRANSAGISDAHGLAHGLDELESWMAHARLYGVRGFLRNVDGHPLLRQLAHWASADDGRRSRDRGPRPDALPAVGHAALR